MGTTAHAANRSVKTILTIKTPDPNYSMRGMGAVLSTIWVLLDSVQQWPALPFAGAGDLWSYTSCNAGFGNTPEWMVDYPPVQRAHPGGVLELDARCHRHSVLSLRRLERRQYHRQLEQCEYHRLRRRPGQTGRWNIPVSSGPIGSTESAPGIRLKAIRDGIQRLRVRPDSKNLGQIPFVNSVLQPIANELDQLESRSERAGGCQAAIGANAPSAFSSISERPHYPPTGD